MNLVTVNESELRGDPWGVFVTGRGRPVRVVDDTTGAVLFYLTSSENLKAPMMGVSSIDVESMVDPDEAEAVYESLAEAAEATGVHRTTIMRALSPEGPVEAVKDDDGNWCINKLSLHREYPKKD